jgi:sulfide:quinone oxidoreductase
MHGDTTRVLIAGGGVAALEAALALRALGEGRVSVELLAPEPLFWYRPMSVSEPFGLGEARHFELQELAAAAGATFLPGTLNGLDASRKLAITSTGTFGYDALLIACGALPRPAISGALTFRGPADTDKLRELLAAVKAGAVRRLAFVVPWGASWTLPAYELALLTAATLAADETGGVELMLVTPEREPLALFGPAASETVEKLLADRGVELHTGSFAEEFADGKLRLARDGSIDADRVVALPRLHGPRLDGVPQTVEGFIPVDSHALVVGFRDVYAAGDITSFPVKQGGVAAQQAGAAAEAIAAAAGADLEPQPFRPVLRGLLLTGESPRYLRREITGGFGETSVVDEEPLWWPPAKIVGRYLAPFLGSLAGVEAPSELPVPDAAVEIEVDLGDGEVVRSTPPRRETAGGPTVSELMSRDLLVVAPEDTLGEAAERMREREVSSALVSDYGRLIGIVTSRDLVRAYAGRVHPSEGRVREWMTAEPVTVSADATLEEAQLLMTEYGFHHVPVLGPEQRPIGLVGLRDVTRRLAPHPADVHVGLGL